MGHMSVLAWIVIGLVAGFLANKLVNKTSGGLFTDLVLGIVGGFVGGFVVDRIPAFGQIFGNLHVMGIAFGPLVIAVLGSVLVLVVYHMVAHR